MKKKLPVICGSWIEFYDYIINRTNNKNLNLIKFNYMENGKITNFSITLHTLKRYCWEELQALRLSTADTYVATFAIENGMRVMAGKEAPKQLIDLLELIEKKYEN